MYLLFVDESGTHGSSHAFVLGAIAVHEGDAQRFQRALDALVVKKLGSRPANLDEYELHAAEMRNAKKPQGKSSRTAVTSIWSNFSRSMRQELLNEAYDLVADFEPADPRLPVTLFGVAIDRNFRPDWTQIEKEQLAYEVLLNKFDVMLKGVRKQHQLPNRGLVIHDRRVVAERDIQSWTSEWRAAAGRVGRLRNLADVPLFADSRATRLLQVADLVSYSIYRRYNPDLPTEPTFDRIWPSFHVVDSQVHGCIHFSPSYGQGACDCEPCLGRLASEATQLAKPSRRRRGRTTAE